MVNAFRERSINLLGKRLSKAKVQQRRKKNFVPNTQLNVGKRERGCTDCGLLYRRDHFTRAQWLKGVGASKCNTCLHGISATQRVKTDDAGDILEGGGVLEGERSPIPNAENTARFNNSAKADFEEGDLDVPFESGNFKYVAKGRYIQGLREGQLCVGKWLKEGMTFDSNFTKDLHAVEKAANIIQAFNAGQFIDKIIRMNRPTVWKLDYNEHPQWAGKRIIVEPYIENFQKFNSNTGWSANETPWPKIMQALSHFSYHVTAGQCVLCDLQGGIYADGVILTDPVILSRKGRRYGVSDLGPRGISNFFAKHKCNEFCQAEWQSPNDQQDYFEARQGSSICLKSKSSSIDSDTMQMVRGNRRHAPTRSSRPYMTEQILAPICEELHSEISDSEILPLVLKSEPIINDGVVPYVKQEYER